MANLVNRVITISGEPASGKSTVINKLKEDYERKGYKVHIWAIGHEFRKIAQERGLSIKEFNDYMEKRSGIDEYIDGRVAEQGKEINKTKRPNDIYIFDSRLAWNNIPESMSVRLTADSNVAGKRVFGDTTRGKEDSYATLEEAISDTENRKQSEVQRYKNRYGVDLQNPDNYNLVIDTSFSRIDDIAKVIEDCLELEMQGEFYAKKWTTPKKLLPLQSEMSTLRDGTYYTFDEMKDILKRDGFKPSEQIEAINVDGKMFIIEGHHRNFAAASLGNTLVPYIEIAKDDEIINGYTKNTARERAKLNERYLSDHEYFWKDRGEDFSYNDIYPGIYQEINRAEKANEEFDEER